MKRRGRGKRDQIRPIPAFKTLEYEIGRAAESGGTVHIALGSGGLVSDDVATSLAALEAVEALADTAVLYNAVPIITVGDPTLVPLAQDALRRAHERHGLIKRYDPDHVRFVAPSSVAYAANAADVVINKDIVTNVMMGAFWAEVSLIADAAARHNLHQSAAATTPDALGALYPATDHLAIGEELYGAAAQLAPKMRYTVSLKTQDIVRLLLIVVIMLMAALGFLGIL